MKIELWGGRAHEQAVTIHGSTRELEIDGGDIVFDDSFRVECIVHRDVDIARIEGKVVAPVTMECSRCLKTFHDELAGEFEIVVRRLKMGEQPPSDIAPSGEQVDTDDIIFLPYNENELEISQHVLDALVLSAPVKPLCSEQCRGLCPICGNDLNEGDCSCGRAPVDDRWGALSELRRDSSDKA
jgi:uncharacterized protein